MNTFTYLLIYLVICAAIALLVPIAKNKWSKYLSDFDRAYRDIGWGWWDDNQSLLSFKIGIVKVLTIIAFVLLTILFFIFTPILLPLIAIWDKKKALSEQGDDYASFMKLYNQTKPSDIKTVDKKAYFDSLVNLGYHIGQLSDKESIENVETNLNEENADNDPYFGEMDGGKTIKCFSCGYLDNIIFDAHEVGDYGAFGYQCQSCGKFYALYSFYDAKLNEGFTRYNGKIYDLKSKNMRCECGGILQHNKPTFCPKCKSKYVGYNLG